MEVAAAAILLGIGAYDYLVSPNSQDDTEFKERERAVAKLYELPNEDTLTDHEIVDKVMDGSIPKLEYKNFDYKIIDGPQKGKDKEFKDDNRELKNICTDIVVNLFLESPKSNFNFLKKVYETLNEAIIYYEKQKELPEGSLILVYKGGNVLRIISNEFLRELPGSAATEIQEYYQNFFKRSDADFSVYVNPNLENYDRVYDDMILIGFILQRKLRRQFMQDKTEYFDYYKYNHDFKAESLDPYFKKMKSMDSLSDPTNHTYFDKRVTNLVFEDVVLPYDVQPIDKRSGDNRLKYIPQKDKAVQYMEDQETIVTYMIETPGDKEDQSIYVQSNETLDFEAGGKVKFALVRSKISFNVYLDNAINVENVLKVTEPVDSQVGGSGNSRNSGKEFKNVGGELIDLSYPHREDSKLGHFYQHINKYIRRYELRHNDQKIEFNSYSLVYLIEDLEFILFQFVSKPWDAPKYEKRLNRLFYLYMIDIFNKVKTNFARKNVLESFTALFNSLIIADIEDMPMLIDAFSAENAELTRHLLINNLLYYLRNLTQLITPMNIPKFKKFLKVLTDNTGIIIDSFDNLVEYCSIDGSIRLKNIYDGDLRSLV